MTRGSCQGADGGGRQRDFFPPLITKLPSVSCSSGKRARLQGRCVPGGKAATYAFSGLRVKYGQPTSGGLWLLEFHQCMEPFSWLSRGVGCLVFGKLCSRKCELAKILFLGPLNSMLLNHPCLCTRHPLAPGVSLVLSLPTYVLGHLNLALWLPP